MDNFDRRLIETAVRYAVEQLPRTRSGKGYMFLREDGTALPKLDVAHNIKHFLGRASLLRNLSEHHQLVLSAIKRAMHDNTDLTNVTTGGKIYWAGTVRVRDKDQLTRLVQAIMWNIEMLSDMNPLTLRFLTGLIDEQERKE